MSDKCVLFKSRKNNHGCRHRCSRGSEFPRHSMNYYPGTHLGMKLRYSKPSIGRCYRTNFKYGGYVRTNRMIGFINKFVGKPYNDLVTAFYILIKDLRNKDVGLSNLEKYFTDNKYSSWRGSYYIDNDGLVQVAKQIVRRKQSTPASKQQIAHNKKVKIPDFGKVSSPRPINKSVSYRYELPESDSLSYDRPQYKAPRFLGNYWCDIDGKMLFLPVYHVPGSLMYAKYCAKTFGHSKPSNPNYYYDYPRTWDFKGYCDKFSDGFRPGEDSFYWAQYMENEWVVPIIPFRKWNSFGVRSAMYREMHQSKAVLLPNTEELLKAQKLVQKCKDNLVSSQTSESWWYGKTEECKMELDRALKKLKRVPKMAHFEVGYGQLYPMVKKKDYEEALLKMN